MNGPADADDRTPTGCVTELHRLHRRGLVGARGGRTGDDRRLAGELSPGVAWAAIVASAVLLGVGQLPPSATLYGSLTPSVVAFVLFVAVALGLVVS